MLSNVFLFTGEEQYLLHQELNRRKTAFAQKHGSDSIFVFKTDNFDTESLNQILYGGGLFAQKKLVIVYGLPFDGFESNKLSLSVAESFIEDFIKKEGKIDPDTILIFVSYKPDKRTRFFNFLSKNLDSKTGIKTFAFKKSNELRQIVLQTKSNLSWTDSALERFVQKTGPSLLHIFNELDKLELYISQNSFPKVLDEHIDVISFGISEVNGFEFFDRLFVSKEKALSMIYTMQENGDYWNAVTGQFLRGLKGLLFTLDCVEQGIKDSKKIASLAKFSPFVAIKALKNINILLDKKEKLRTFYKGLIDVEYDIKNGKKSELMFWLYLKEFVYNL